MAQHHDHHHGHDHGHDAPARFGPAFAVGATLNIALVAAQVEGGFRPFSHAPSRVPYSWDMFAIRIDRCVVGWSPPLWVEGARIGRWRDRSAPIEFDTVYNDARHYEAAAQAGCAYRVDPGTVASIECLLGDGGVHEAAMACP